MHSDNLPLIVHTPPAQAERAMLLLPLQTTRIKPGDDLVLDLLEAVRRDEGLGVREQDILVLSSKAVATAERRIIDLSTLTVTDEAKKLSERCRRSPEFCQAVLEETRRRNGIIHGTCPDLPCPSTSLGINSDRAKWGAILTELRPEGLSHGTILTANAGLDESNVEKGYAVGWPEDPVQSVGRLRRELEDVLKSQRKQEKQKSSFDSFASFDSSIAVILSDSCCAPRRSGVTAFALAVSGLDPLQSQMGKPDLFGKPLQITTEAVADQLATAANFLMGNAGQSIPAVIIRDHGLSLSDFEGWVPGIGPEEDLFGG